MSSVVTTNHAPRPASSESRRLRQAADALHSQATAPRVSQATAPHVSPAHRQAPHAPELSLIIPTFNEREGVHALIDALAAALDGLDWEAVFVDDSTDGTDRLIAALAATDPRVRLLHRSENRGGLAGAVVDGLAIARGKYVLSLIHI